MGPLLVVVGGAERMGRSPVPPPRWRRGCAGRATRALFLVENGVLAARRGHPGALNRGPSLGASGSHPEGPVGGRCPFFSRRLSL